MSDFPQSGFIILGFIFGTAIGSFLNVLILRLPKEKTLQGRSACTHCGHNLVWHDLVPVLSFVFQGGKCKYCRKPISPRYPIIELVTGALFALAMWYFPVTDLLSGMILLKAAIVIAISVVVFMIDYEHYLILNKVVFPGIALMAILALALTVHSRDLSYVWQGLFGAVGAFIPFWLIWYLSKGRWMGFGDVKLMAFMGLALGVKGVIVAIFLAVGLGTVVGIGLIALNKKQMSSRMPFGTFLAIATITALFLGPQLWDGYWAILGIA
jgi:prepilin signal peptidase PulO-like enzyme (type II secretory pathway)